MDVSVVVPLYNKRAEIGRCLRSVCAQLVQPDEVLVVDDGSTDGGSAVAASVGCPGLRIITQTNQGAAAARNTGIREARNDLIAFLDADDEWLPGFLEEILRLLHRYPQAAAFGTAYLIDKGPLRRYEVVCDVPAEMTLLNAGEGALDYFAARPCLWSSSTAVRKSAFDVVGPFRVGLRQVEDQDMWFRIGCAFPIAYSRRPCAVWHWTASNRSTALAPAEEDCMGTSLKELLEKGVILPGMLPKARAFARRFRLAQAIALATYHRGRGLAALRQWRAEYGAGPRWYLRYAAFLIHPETYWLPLRCGSRVKDFLRSLRRMIRLELAGPRAGWAGNCGAGRRAARGLRTPQ